MDNFGEVAYEGVSIYNDDDTFPSNTMDSLALKDPEEVPNKKSGMGLLIFLSAALAFAVTGIWAQDLKGMFTSSGCPPSMPSKISGGGRDWILNDDGTISTKLDPNLVLGAGPVPMILVPKDSPMAFVFEDNQSLMDGEAVPLVLSSSKNMEADGKLGVGKLFDDEMEWGGWEFITSTVVPSEKAVLVELVDNNFLKLVDEELVLDVSNWNIAPFSTVNFVGGTDPVAYPTYAAGGGRDWVVNEDGTIAARNDPNLVLGRGMAPMVLLPKGSPRQLVFENMDLLAAGKTAPLTLSSPREGMGVGKKGQVKMYECIPYIESGLRASEHAISVRFEDGNFLMLDGMDFAFDVSFWKPVEGNTVNFVSTSG